MNVFTLFFLFQSEDAVRRFKGDIQLVIGTILHKKQPWFHGAILRNEADRRLKSHGSQHGMFLVRERGSIRNSYVLGLCHQKKIYHYLFEPNEYGQLSIRAGPPFDNLMAVINFYSQKSEGLLTTLQTPCDVCWFEFRPKVDTKNILLHPEIQSELRRTLSRSEKELKKYKQTGKQELCHVLKKNLKIHNSRIFDSPACLVNNWRFWYENEAASDT